MSTCPRSVDIPCQRRPFPPESPRWTTPQIRRLSSAPVALQGTRFMSGQPNRQLIAHMVYFTLKDASSAAQEKLVADCHRYLKGAPGVVFFAAGARVPD